MNDRISSQISEERRAEVDAMSKDELRYEIERGGGRFQLLGMIPYLKLRLAKLEDDEKAEERREDVSLAKNANTISAKAYRLSKWAILISAAAFLWSIFAPD